MRKMIFASHGSLADGMKSAVAMILGEQFVTMAYSLDTWLTPQSILEEIKKNMAQGPEDEYLILCDIKSGSVHNALLELCISERVSIITGMNLSLAVELSVSAVDFSRQTIETVIEMARDNIQYYSKETMELLKEEEGEDSIW